jgi:hypothetical protein
MSIATEFHNWSDHPSEKAKSTMQGSPALKRVRDYHLARWGGISLSVPSLYQPRTINNTTRLSAHAGCAVDLRWANPGPGRDIVVREMLPFYIGDSHELHIQAIHDYVGCRVWRANRSGDANGGWKTQPKGSHDGNMGNPSSQWLHLEVNLTGWDDDRPVEDMIGAGLGDGTGPITDLDHGFFGLFPLDRAKPSLTVGDKGDHVRYAQSVIFFKGGGAIELDSDFGQQTRTRVMDLQRVFAMKESGDDPATWGALDFLATS